MSQICSGRTTWRGAGSAHYIERPRRRSITAEVKGSGAALDAIPSPASGPGQLIARVDEARAKLAALKPAERRALGLIAAGYSYKEIGELSGWTYTKTNRCAAEGRAALRRGQRVE